MVGNDCEASHSCSLVKAVDSLTDVRLPLKRKTANRCGGSVRTETAGSVGAGTWSDCSLAGMTKAMDRLVVAPDMNTGVVMEIFCWA